MCKIETRKLSRILCMIMVFLLFSISFVSAAEKSLIKEEYITSNSENTCNYKPEEKIKEEGTEYELKSVKYEVVGENESFIERTEEYNNLSTKEVPTTKDFKLNGKNVTLKLVDENITYSEETKTVSESYNGYIYRPEFSKTKTVRENNTDYTATLVNVKEQNITKGYTAKVKFIGAPGSTYYLNGKELTMEDNSPLWHGYENDVIEYLELPSASTVISGKWTSDYVNEGNDVVRYAEFRGQRPATNYTVNYSYTTYSCKAKYNNGEDRYKIKVVCTYEKVGLSTIQKIAIGAGIVILAGLIVLILYIIAKRRKDAENDE